METDLVDTEPCGGVSLGIEIDEEGRVTRQGEAGREIDRGRRLADTALLVNDGDCSGYILTTAALLLLDRRPIILCRAQRPRTDSVVCSTWHTWGVPDDVPRGTFAYSRRKIANLRVSPCSTPATVIQRPTGSRYSFGGPEAMTTPPGLTR